MGPISVHATIDAPRQRVFDAICDLSRRPAWTDHFVSDYRLARIEASGEGAAARFHAGAPGVAYMETVIAAAEPPHTVTERGLGGRGNRTGIRARWDLSGGEGGPTEVELTFATEPGSLVARLREARAAGWWRRRWKRALRRLAEQLEEPAAGAPGPVGVGGLDRHPGAVH
ncbi:MAG: SRPBCC family protein [Solirubrobacterales bacterium]